MPDRATIGVAQRRRVQLDRKGFANEFTAHRHIHGRCRWTSSGGGWSRVSLAFTSTRKSSLETTITTPVGGSCSRRAAWPVIAYARKS